MTEKVRLGVRYRLVYSGRSRWSAGKEHVQLRLVKGRGNQWRLACRPHDTSGIMPYHLSDTPPDVDVPIEMCAKCAPTIKGVFG